MKRSGFYITYEYEVNDERIIDTIDSFINEHILSIKSFFDMDSIEEKAKLKIWNTKENFDERVKKRRNNNLDVPKWTVGVSDNEGNIDCVSLRDFGNTSHSRILNDYENALLYYKKMILHEYVHFINTLYCKKNNYPRTLPCLQEGIAQVLSLQKEKLNKEFNYSLEDILDSNNCYDGWYLLTKYILDNYSKEYFLSLLKDNDYAKKEITKIYNEIVENKRMQL